MNSARIRSLYSDIPGLEQLRQTWRSLLDCDTVEQADAVVALLACQIVMTGRADYGRVPNAALVEWARRVWNDGGPINRAGNIAKWRINGNDSQRASWSVW